jgi:hydrogenase maturation protease
MSTARRQRVGAHESTARVVVVGVGGEYRRDDAVGLAVAAELAGAAPPGLAVHATDGEPTRLLEAWTGAALAILIDAVLVPDTPARPAVPGRVHRTDPAAATPATGTASSHGLGVPEAYALGRALDRLPARLVVYAVEVADVRPGLGLSPAVAAAVPGVVAAVLTECRDALDNPEVP